MELHKRHYQKDEHQKIEAQNSRGQQAPHNRTQDRREIEQWRLPVKNSECTTKNNSVKKKL